MAATAVVSVEFQHTVVAQLPHMCILSHVQLTDVTHPGMQ